MKQGAYLVAELVSVQLSSLHTVRHRLLDSKHGGYSCGAGLRKPQWQAPISDLALSLTTILPGLAGMR